MLQRLTPDQTLAIIIIEHLPPPRENLFKIRNVLMEIILVPRHTHKVPSQPVTVVQGQAYSGGQIQLFCFSLPEDQGLSDVHTHSFLWGICVEKVTKTGMYF